MSEIRRRRIVTPHSDENPELSQSDSTGEPLAAYTTEGPPSAALYQKERETRRAFGYIPKDGEQVIDEDIYIPPSDD